MTHHPYDVLPPTKNPGGVEHEKKRKATKKTQNILKNKFKFGGLC
jgi:hypothetical protein